MKVNFLQKLKQKLRIITAFLFAILVHNLAVAQITGKVTDANSGEDLIGVNIIVVENSIGTISDYNGNFSIDAEIGQNLTFSYIGYKPQTIEITSNQLNVALSEDGEILDEVVVIGYGSVGKKDLTGVVTKVDERTFNKGVNSSPETLLNGKVAGLQVSNNGEPGGNNRIRLRGGTSLDASSSPLIVIDGVPIDNRGLASGRNPMNFVNAADVESISVLKDASAAAIYGSRGANGVIIIKTKTGQSGKLRVNYSNNVGISRLGGSVPILSGNNFRDAISAKAPQELEFLGDASTDWLKEVTQNAIGTEHNLSLSGGTKKISYYLSAGYQNTDGVIKTSNNQNTSIAGSINAKLFDDALTLNFDTKTGFSKDRFSDGVIGAALTFDPTRPVNDEESEFGGYFQWEDPLAVNNPVSTLELTNHTGSSIRTLNSISAEYALPFVEGLSLKASFSSDYVTGEKRNLKDPLLKDGDVFNRGGYLFNEELRNYANLFETFASYKKDLENINSSMTLTAGYSWQDFDRENRWEEGNGLEQFENDWIYTTDIRQDSFLVHNRLISFFGRANMTFSDRYLLTLSLRRDGSSRFAESNRWGLFPAVALGWRILEEPFAENWNIFSNLKLRASWGITGNEDIKDYLFTTFYSYSSNDATYQFGDNYVNMLRGIGVDPNIKWEETRSTNFGVDFGFFNDRLTGTVDLYQKYTSDLLFTIAAGAFTNLSDRILTNIGEMENRGVELELNGVVADKQNWDWNLGFNIALNRNEIKKLDNSNDPAFPGYETGGISGDVGQTIQVLRVGESIETFRTFQHLIDDNGKPRTDNVDFNGDGLIDLLDIYADIDADGLINEKDLIVGESAAPKVILGLTSNTRFKKFDLSATFRANLGNYVYNNVASSTGFYERLTDRVTNNVHETAFTNNFNKRQLRSDVYIENASFLRLDNVSLGYNLSPNKIFRNLRIFTTIQNVFVLTGYTGLDPELPQFNGGIDNNIYPISRRFLVGLNAQF